MGWLRFLLPLLILGLGAVRLESQETRQTEAQQDGLSGPVRSVSMHIDGHPARPDGVAAWAMQYTPGGDIEYDRFGYRTAIGQLDGPKREFMGTRIDLVRDGNGRLLERTVRLVPSGDVITHDTYGPFGIAASTSFTNGSLNSQRTIAYDALGNVLDDDSVDASGKVTVRTQYRRNADGQWTERTLWMNGTLHSHETYDPETDLQHYEEYDDSGAVVVAFTHQHNQTASYWSASDDPNAGTVILDKLDGSASGTARCQKGDVCHGRTRHPVFLDKDMHNPTMVEIRGDDGKLLGRVRYEYQMDEHENWTARKVWLQEGEQAAPTLYESDSRTITYWPE